VWSSGECRCVLLLLFISFFRSKGVGMEVVFLSREMMMRIRDELFWKEIVEASHHHDCRHCITTCIIMLVFLLIGSIICSIYQVVVYQNHELFNETSV
jgi:hypothetical protein